jgi:type VI secretion system protein ImpB
MVMAGEGSVAPKERVNITYRPATGDAKEEVELPLKVLVMGDFTFRQDDTPLEERKPIDIDKDNFNDVLKAQNLALNFSVPAKISEKEEEEAQLNVKLDIKSLKDFEPDAVVKKVPELRKLIELREALKALKGPLGNVPEFRKRIQGLIQDVETREKLLKELGIEE